MANGALTTQQQKTGRNGV